MKKALIKTLAFGGEGITRDDGIVTFIPFTAPGDEVEFCYTKKKKNFAKGKLLHLITPSPDRVTPFCSYFGKCGGCQLQHLSYEKQLEAKRGFIQEALERIAKIDVSVPPVIGTQKNRAYREHITLKINEEKIGYADAEDNHFLCIQSCPIFLNEDHPFFKKLQILLIKLNRLYPLSGSMRCIKNEDQNFVVHIHLDHPILFNKAKEFIEFFLEDHPEIAAIRLSARNGEMGFKEMTLKKEILGLKIFFDTRSFLQNHLEQAENIYQSVIDFFNTKEAHLLDLYCGVGTTSLLLAQKGMKVLGIENNENAVINAKYNADYNQINNIEFIASDVVDILPKLQSAASFDYLLLNPPRTGVDKETLELLMQIPFKQVSYISCMPSTLARDLVYFVKNGYRIEKIQGFDMFPQTTHVETVVLMSKKKE